MDFIDWDGNGRIDPVDIGISISLKNDDNSPPPKPMKKSGYDYVSIVFIILVILFYL
jgi:hypothetical protein